MVLLCKASKPQTPEYSWCWIIAQFPQAWEGKAEACCTIKVNYPGAETTSGSSTIATLLLLIPTLPHPQDSRKAEGEVQTSVELSWAPEPSITQMGLGGRDFPPVPQGWVDAARPCWSFGVILKHTGFPSAPHSLLAQVWAGHIPELSLLQCVLWGCAGGALWGQSGGREGFAIPTGFQMFLEVLARDFKCS